MNTMPSRIERLWEKLENDASKGNWCCKVSKIYPSEVRRIKRQWHVCVKVVSIENGLATVIITWSYAFLKGIDYKQSWYISKLTDEIPQVETPAQKLFLMAARA